MEGNNIEGIVKNVIASSIGIEADEVKDDLTLLELEYDSLDVVELIVNLEKKFYITILEDEITTYSKVSDVANVVTSKIS